MKKLFAVILSLGLIMSPMSGIGMKSAHAAEKGGGYMTIILGMANGIVGTTVLAKCSLGTTQPSLAIYMAGSLVFVAAEVMGGKQKKSSTSQNAANLDEIKKGMTEGGDFQKATIEAQIKNEEDNLKHIQKKKTWMNATLAVYAAATAVAAIELMLKYLSFGSKDDTAGPCKGNPAFNFASTQAITLAYAAAQGYAGSGMMGAGMAVAGQLAAPYIADLLATVTAGASIQDMLMSMLNSAIGRMVFFALCTAAVASVVGSLNAEETDIKKRLEALRQVLAQLNGLGSTLAEGPSATTAGADGGVTSGGTNGSTDPAAKKPTSITKLPEAKPLPKHCFSKTSTGGVDYSENCSSPMKIPRPSMDGKFNIPTLVAAANSGTDLAQALSDGDIGKAEVEAGKLGSMAGRIDAIKNELVKKANEDLKKNGKKPIDLDAEVNKQMANFSNSLNKAGYGKFAGGKSSFGSGNVGTSAVSDSNVNAAGDVGAANVAGAGEIAVGAVDPSAVADADALAGVDSGAAGGEGVLDPNAAKASSLSDSLDQYESNESDISKDPSVSIFKQVSNRYFLNYTKIFNKKKIDPPLAPKPAEAR